MARPELGRKPAKRVQGRRPAKRQARQLEDYAAAATGLHGTPGLAPKES